MGANEGKHAIGATIVNCFSVPVLKFLEGLVAGIRAWVLGDVVHEEDCSRTAVECFYYGPERLLASCVPDLKFDGGVIVDIDDLRVKFYAQGWVVPIAEFIPSEPIQ